MKRVGIRKPGGWQRLEIESAPDRVAGAGEVRVAVEAIGVNYADCIVRMGLYASAKEYVGWPITPGFEVAGRVDQVGEGLTAPKVGDRVIALTRFDGYATQVVVPAHQTIPIPDGWTMEQAAAFAVDEQARAPRLTRFIGSSIPPNAGLRVLRRRLGRRDAHGSPASNDDPERSSPSAWNPSGRRGVGDGPTVAPRPAMMPTAKAFVWMSLLAAAAALSAGCAVDAAADDEGDDESAEEVVASEASAVSASSVRVMTYNIKYGAESGLDLRKLAAVIKESNPDIVGLQEVDEGTRRSGNKQETNELSALTGMRYRYFGANFDFDGGKYGLAILSKYPLANTRTIRLDNRTKRENGYEPRIAVAADATVKGRKITFVTVHASLHESERDDNARAILAALGSNAPRAIVCGDFNETPSKDIGDLLTGAGMVDAFKEKHRWQLGFTSPATFPIKRIDFIYRGKSFGKTAHAWVPNTKASDHRPVAAVIPLP